MPTAYREASSEVVKLADRLIHKHYPELLEADVSITYWFASNDMGAALTVHGWPAKALVRVNKLRDRVAGLSDASIEIDEAGWDEWDDDHKEAIIDHELHHIEVKRDKHGHVELDLCNRPKLKLRKHDFEFGGFHEIVARHGAASAEAVAVNAVRQIWTQREFDFDDGEIHDGAAGDESRADLKVAIA